MKKNTNQESKNSQETVIKIDDQIIINSIIEEQTEKNNENEIIENIEEQKNIITETFIKQVEPILTAPTVEQPSEIVIAEFRVKGTMIQLKALGQYMEQNGIIYSNI